MYFCRARPRVGPLRVSGAREGKASRKVRPYNLDGRAAGCPAMSDSEVYPRFALARLEEALAAMLSHLVTEDVM